MNKDSIVITGMSVITPIGDELDTFYQNLLAGKSAITNWKSIEVNNIYSKVGGDLYAYKSEEKLAELKDKIPEEMFIKAKKLMHNAPFSEKITIITALKLMLDANLMESPYEAYDMALVIAGHNLNQHYEFKVHNQFMEEPDFIEGQYALRGLDTDHAGIVSEILGTKGPTYSTGAACASGNVGLRLCADEIKHHGMKAGIIIAPVLDFSPLELQGLCIMDAITYKSFNDDPTHASRPYDTKREGFVPSHGAAGLIVERYEDAKNRGAKIYAELLAVESSSDSNHLPNPSSVEQTRLIKKVLDIAKLDPSEIDYINAHATSTPLGDITELTAIENVFGKHRDKVKINAPKSMLGHACWSAATVETVGTIMQMNNGVLHPSINIENLDPKVKMDVCANEKVEHEVRYCLKNSFGFGGLNCLAIYKNVNL